MNIEELIREYPNDMELGKQIRKMYYEQQDKIKELIGDMEGKFIYESPDGGNTITKRPFGAPLSERVIIAKSKSSIFPPEVEYTDEYYKSTLTESQQLNKAK